VEAQAPESALIICASRKPEEGGFPGRAFEEDPRLSIRSVVRLSTVASEVSKCPLARRIS